MVIFVLNCITRVEVLFVSVLLSNKKVPTIKLSKQPSKKHARNN